MQIKRQTGLSYKSALFMMHRIRFAMADDHSLPEPMTGTVEVDETYVGGKPRHKGAHNIKKRGRGTDKAPVVAMVQRGGLVRAMTVQKVNAKNLKQLIRQNVHPSARIMTDEAPFYRGLNREFEGGHKTINHSQGKYADGDVTTNSAEGFFSIFKRGMVGTLASTSSTFTATFPSSSTAITRGTWRMGNGRLWLFGRQKGNGSFTSSQLHHELTKL